MSKPTALLAFLRKQDIAILKKYVQRHRRTVFLLPDVADQETLHAIEAIGGQVKLLDLSVSQSALEEAAQAMHVASAALKSAGVLHQPASSERTATMLAAYEKVLDEKLPSVISLLDELERVEGEYFIESILLSEEITWLGKTTVAWAKRHGISSILLAQGTGILNDFGIAHYESETIAVDGVRSAEYYLDRAVPRERIEATGNFHWNVFNQLKSKKDAIRQDLCARADLNAGLPIIIYGIALGDGDTISDRGNLASELIVFLGVYHQLTKSGIQPQLVVVGQPANGADVQDQILEMVRRLDIPLGRIRHVAADEKSWVAAADVVVSIDSALSVEALLAETPAINLLTPFGLIADPKFSPNDGVVSCEPAELADMIVQVLTSDNLKALLMEKMRAAAARFNRGVDGMAEKRLCDLIDKKSRINPADGVVNYVRRSVRRTLPLMADNAKHTLLTQANKLNQMNRLLRWKRIILGK